MPQSARLSAGGGSNGYLGNAQMNRDIFMLGLPLGTEESFVDQSFENRHFSLYRFVEKKPELDLQSMTFKLEVKLFQRCR